MAQKNSFLFLICTILFWPSFSSSEETRLENEWSFLDVDGPIFVAGCRGSQWEYGKYMVLVSTQKRLNLFVIRDDGFGTSSINSSSDNSDKIKKLVPEFVGSIRAPEGANEGGIESWVGGEWVLKTLNYLKDQPFTFLEEKERTSSFVVDISKENECPKF